MTSYHGEICHWVKSVFDQTMVQDGSENGVAIELETKRWLTW